MAGKRAKAVIAYCWHRKPGRLGGVRNRASEAESGFTFLEVVMAVSILAMLLAGVHKLQGQMVSMIQATRFITLAPLLAQSQMAEMERRNFKDIQNDSGNFGGAYPGYVWSLRMETPDSEVLKKRACPMKKIEITVSCNNGERTYRLRTYRVAPDKAAAETQDKHSGPA